MQAVEDYKYCVRKPKKQTKECNIKEIESFLLSAWCQTLLMDSDMSGKDILKHLQAWREEYQIQKRRRKRKLKKG